MGAEYDSEALYEVNMTARIDEACQQGHMAFSGLGKMASEVQDDDSSSVLRAANMLTTSTR